MDTSTYLHQSELTHLVIEGMAEDSRKAQWARRQVRSEDEIAERCAGTTGTWCRDFYNQKPIPQQGTTAGQQDVPEQMQQRSRGLQP
eukprot:jgi/Botrbrau1/20039/Bobra.200_1s0044.1